MPGWPTMRPSAPATCNIQFWYIGPMEGPILHFIAFSDASRYGAKKKDDEIRLIGSWDVEVLFQKVLPAGHNAGQVIIEDHIQRVSKHCRVLDISSPRHLWEFSGSWLYRVCFEMSQKRVRTPPYDIFRARYTGFSKSSCSNPSQTKVVTGSVVQHVVFSEMYNVSTHRWEKGTRTHLTSSYRALIWISQHSTTC